MGRPRKFEGKGKNTEIETTVRIDIREVESTKDGEVTSSRTLEESRIINRGITRARDIELEFRDCKQSGSDLGLLHHKFFIGRGRPFRHNQNGELSLIVGTYNCSWGAHNSLESLMIFRREDCREIIDAYPTEFFGIVCSRKLAWGYWPLA